MSLFTPAWKSDNLNKAMKAVENCSDRQKLKEIATQAPDASVRLAAVEKLTDDDCLGWVVFEAYRQHWIETAKKAIPRISDPQKLVYIIRNHHEEELRSTALQCIRSPQTLTQVAAETDDARIGVAAVARIGDTSCLSRIMQKSPLPEVKKAALEKCEDKDAVIAFMRAQDVRGFCQYYPCIKDPALKKEAFEECGIYDNAYMIGAEDISLFDGDDEFLAQIAFETSSESVQKAAADRIRNKDTLDRLKKKIEQRDLDNAVRLSKLLQETDNPYRARDAVYKLKEIYRRTTGRSIKAVIEAVPQKRYFKRYSIGLKEDGCHEDVPDVVFCLDD